VSEAVSRTHDIVVTDPVAGVRLITLSRPEARNALRHQTMIELADALEAADRDDSIRCVVLAGGPKAFAAGADIAEMAALDGPALEHHPRTLAWQRIWAVGTPIVAAVEGWALGGGCELVLSCDIAIAGESARFGQPEITLGWMPGAGGTQRLPRAVGKSTAMQMVLTGDPIDAPSALRSGLVSEVVPAGDALARATAVAQRIAAHPRTATRLAKAAVLGAFTLPLSDGLRQEHASFRELASSGERNALMRNALESRGR
jgi:enoyl-CoA hydratase